MINKTPGVCGGVACVDDTRIPVWVIIKRLRVNNEKWFDVAGAYGLDAGQMVDVIEYFSHHEDEILALIKGECDV